MNLSKKTIKHILRILENKCIEVPTESTVLNKGWIRIESRDFIPAFTP